MYHDICHWFSSLLSWKLNIRDSDKHELYFLNNVSFFCHSLFVVKWLYINFFCLHIWTTDFSKLWKRKSLNEELASWIFKLWEAKNKTNSQFLEELMIMTFSILIDTHNTVHHQNHKLSLLHSSCRAFWADNLYKINLFFSLASVSVAFCFFCWALYNCYKELFLYCRCLIYISSKTLILTLNLLWSF